MVLILVSWLSGCSYSLLEWWSSSSALPQLYGEKLNIAFHLSLLHPNQRAKKNSTTWPMGYLGSRLRPHIIINRWRSRWAPSRWWWWWKNKLSLIVDETKKLNSSHDRALHVNHHLFFFFFFIFCSRRYMPAVNPAVRNPPLLKLNLFWRVVYIWILIKSCSIYMAGHNSLQNSAEINITTTYATENVFLETGHSYLLVRIWWLAYEQETVM